MEICFGKISRKVSVQNDVDELWAAIVREIPGLGPHRNKLQMRYIDDEGDDICVTTNDELQEAICVGKETSKGFLSLNLSVAGMGASTRTSIEQTASPQPCNDDESTEDEEENDAPPIPTRNRENSTQPDVIQVIRNAGISAISGINQALNSASSEIDKMLSELGTASTKQKKAEQELAVVKAELAKVNSQFVESEQQYIQLTHDLTITKALLSDSEQKVKSSSKRVEDLEKQLSEKTVWEKKFQVAEAERVRLDEELQALRSALQVLSLNQSTAATTPTTPVVTKSKPVTTPMITAPTTVEPVTTKPIPVSAEVVSNEVIPASPVTESARSPELPPPYEAPVAATSFPESCSAQLHSN